MWNSQSEPVRMKLHDLGEDGVAVGGLAGLVQRRGRQKHSPCGQPAAGHGLVADGRAGLVQEGHGRCVCPKTRWFSAARVSSEA